MMRNLIVPYLIIRAVLTNKAKEFARGDMSFGFPISDDNGFAGTRLLWPEGGLKLHFKFCSLPGATFRVQFNIHES